MIINRTGNRLEFELDDKERQRIQKNIRGGTVQTQTGTINKDTELQDVLTRLAETEQNVAILQQELNALKLILKSRELING